MNDIGAKGFDRSRGSSLRGRDLNKMTLSGANRAEMM